jgi:type VI secretion system protein ImpH
MESPSRQQTGALTEDILRNAHRYNFYQAIYRLRQLCPDTLIQYKANNSLAFPAGDLQMLTQANGNITAMINLMGLAGVDSPLPHYFLTAATQQENDTGSLFNDFLQLFNQRIYQLLYQAWEKMQCHVHRTPLYLTMLNTLSGHALAAMPHKIYAQTALYGQKIHSVIGLKTLLEAYLKLPLTIKSFVYTWVPVNASPLQTQQLTLGDNTFLGRHVLTQCHRIKIYLGSLSVKQAWPLLNDHTQLHFIKHLIQNYLPCGITFVLYLRIQHDSQSRFSLGDQPIKLGSFGWIGQLRAQQQTIKIPNTFFN